MLRLFELSRLRSILRGSRPEQDALTSAIVEVGASPIPSSSVVTFSERSARTVRFVRKAQATCGGAPTTIGVATRRFRLVSPVMAVALGVLVLALFVLAVVLAGANHDLVLGRSVSGNFALGGLAFGAVGVLVAGRQPLNSMGWLLLGSGGFLLLSGDASSYLQLDHFMYDGTLPLGSTALFLQPAFAPSVMMLALAVVVFPDGRLASRARKWVLWTFVAVCGAELLAQFAVSGLVMASHQVQVTSFGELMALYTPSGGYSWFKDVQYLFGFVFAMVFLGGAVGQWLSYRRSSGDRRIQERLFFSGAVISAAAALLLVGLPTNSGNWADVHEGLPFGFAALPVGIAIGILKYRLYDIGRIVSRTLSYAIVTGLVVGVYVGMVTLVTKALGFSSPVAVAASTLAAVALFNPLRHRVQRVVDRRFNRPRYDADATVAVFTARLREAVDLETVRTELLEVVNRAVEPAHASVWIRRRE